MRLFLLLVFLLGDVGVREPLLRETFVYPSKPKEHHFPYVYQQIRKLEGTYVNHPNDKGRETYGGISRKLHPKWQGWEYIDEAKPLERYDTVPRAEFWVLDWYLDLWVKEGFETIEDRELALNLFDFRIHSSPRTVELFTNRVLTRMGCEPTRIGEDWIDGRFNQVEPVEFILRLKIQRLILFNYIVTKYPSQKVFYFGWVNRISNI